MTEIWLPIPDSNHEVSNLGRVRNAATLYVLRGRRHTHGYLRVNLGAFREEYVHRLVCAAFKGPPPEGHECDHINRVRSDNRAENLRWITPEQNKAARRQPLGVAHPFALLTEADVHRIRRGPFFRGRDSQIARELGVSRETVRDVRNGKYWRHLK